VCKSCGHKWILDTDSLALTQREFPSEVIVRLADSCGKPLQIKGVKIQAKRGFSIAEVQTDDEGTARITREHYERSRKEWDSWRIMDHPGDYSLIRYVTFWVDAPRPFGPERLDLEQVGQNPNVWLKEKERRESQSKMTLRRMLFTLYGAAIGVAYLAILGVFWPLSLAAMIVFSIVVVAVFSYYGNRLPKAAEMSNWQVLVAIPLFPFATLGGIVSLGFVAIFMAVVWPYAAVRAGLAERRFRAMMKTKGRFASLEDLRPRLVAGEGTLIEDMGPKGPYHLWWTQDDLSSYGSPASTREDFIAIFEGKGHPFNSRCLEEYLDENAGTAWLTPIPARFAASGRLAEMFPLVKTAKVFRLVVRREKKSADGQ